jgi:hypothetical protein
MIIGQTEAVTLAVKVGIAVCMAGCVVYGAWPSRACKSATVACSPRANDGMVGLNCGYVMAGFWLISLSFQLASGNLAQISTF